MKFVGVIVAIILLVLPTAAWAAPNMDAGTGAPPVGSGPASNNVPDSDGKAWDRLPEQHSDDWNNGCQPWHEGDDNEGVCGETFSPPTAIITPRVFPREYCKLVLIGETPEVFPDGVDVRDPQNEAVVIAEAHYFLEVSVERGTTVQILWYDSFWGHGDSPVSKFTCVGGTTVLNEPPLRPWFQPRLQWRLK